MSFYYVPQRNGAQPIRALKMLIKTILWCAVIGFAIMILGSLFWEKHK